MNPPETETTAIQDSYSDPADDDTTYTDWDDEATTGADVDLDDDELGSTTTDDAAEGNESGSYDDSELDNESDDVAEEAASTVAQEESSQTASSYDNISANISAGKYMVIAGTYRQKVNATNQVAKLRRLGYNNSSVASFDRGSYAVALVDRFSSYSQAKTLVRKLADNGVEAMIKEKN